MAEDKKRIDWLDSRAKAVELKVGPLVKEWGLRVEYKTTLHDNDAYSGWVYALVVAGLEISARNAGEDCYEFYRPVDDGEGELVFGTSNDPRDTADRIAAWVMEQAGMSIPIIAAK